MKYKEEPGTVLVKADPEVMLPTAVMASAAAVPIEESRSSRTSCTVVLSLFVNSSKAPISDAPEVVLLDPVAPKAILPL